MASKKLNENLKECIKMLHVISDNLSMLSGEQQHSYNMINDSFESDPCNYIFTNSDYETLTDLYEVVKKELSKNAASSNKKAVKLICRIDENLSFISKDLRDKYDELKERSVNSLNTYNFSKYDIDLLLSIIFNIEDNKSDEADKNKDTDLLMSVISNKLYGIIIPEEIMFIRDLYNRYKKDEKGFKLGNDERSTLNSIISSKEKSEFEYSKNKSGSIESCLLRFIMTSFEFDYLNIKKNRYNGLSAKTIAEVDSLYDTIKSTNELFDNELGRFYRICESFKPLKKNPLVTKYSKMLVKCKYNGIGKGDVARFKKLIKEREYFAELLPEDQEWFVYTFESKCLYHYDDLDSMYDYIEESNDSGDFDDELEEVSLLISKNNASGISVLDYNRINKIYKNICVFYRITKLLYQKDLLSPIDAALLELINDKFKSTLIDYCTDYRKFTAFDKYLTKLNAHIMYLELVNSNFEDIDKRIVSGVRFKEYSPIDDYTNSYNRSQLLDIVDKLINKPESVTEHNIEFMLTYVLQEKFTISSNNIAKIKECYNKKDLTFWETFSLNSQSEDDIRKYAIKDTVDGTFKICLSYICQKSQMSEEFIKELSFITCRDVFSLRYYNKTHIDEFNKVLRMGSVDEQIKYLKTLEGSNELDSAFINRLYRCVSNKPSKLSDRLDWRAIYTYQKNLSSKFKSDNINLCGKLLVADSNVMDLD